MTLRAYQDWESSNEEDPKGIKWPHAKALGEFLEVDPEQLVRRPDEVAPLGATSDDVLGLRVHLHRVEFKLDQLLARTFTERELEEIAEGAEAIMDAELEGLGEDDHSASQPGGSKAS